MKRFVDQQVSKVHRFSLGRDTQAGESYLSIPVANRLTNYEEYYKLEPAQYDHFLTRDDAAACFAEECRRQEHDDLLILAAGSDRGTAI